MVRDSNHQVIWTRLNSVTCVIQRTAGRRAASDIALQGITRAITDGIQAVMAVTEDRKAPVSIVTIILINYDTHHSVPAVMRVISKAKAITMVEEMAPSNKTRIAALADVIECPAVVFDGCRMSGARGLHTQDPVSNSTDRVLVSSPHIA